MPKRRPTPAQRRAAARLGQIGKSLRLAREPGDFGEVTEITPPALATLPSPGGRGAGGEGELSTAISVEIPPALASADPLPVLPTVQRGAKLEKALRRLQSFKTPLDLIREPGVA